MSRLVRFVSPGQAQVINVDLGSPDPGEVQLETLYSGISAGTELTAYRGTNPYLESRWEPDRRLFLPGDSTQSYPLDGWGYEEVGRVVAVGSSTDDDLVGRLAWGAWGHRSHALRPSHYVRERLLAQDQDPMSGVFAKIGAIALNAVLDADIHVGETVVVFGAGVPGQLVAQLARLNGGMVTVVDLVPLRLDVAGRLGAARTLDARLDEVAVQVRAMTENRGADVVIEMSGSYAALHEAVRTAAYSSRVVASGFFQGAAATVRLGEEFHHNRISIVGSQISGVAPQLQHRWDEMRMSTTVLDLVHRGLMAVRPLITHVLPDSAAPEAFEMLDRDPDEALQVVLDYGVSQ
ncbi:MAG TPA: zinc-binding alcohol dehydrogenase [Actinomycetales bacterium]|nr:zinc-binding alcohol dehydrogenase [Actinomycetales bacterium]